MWKLQFDRQLTGMQLPNHPQRSTASIQFYTIVAAMIGMSERQPITTNNAGFASRPTRGKNDRAVPVGLRGAGRALAFKTVREFLALPLLGARKALRNLGAIGELNSLGGSQREAQ